MPFWLLVTIKHAGSMHVSFCELYRNNNPPCVGPHWEADKRRDGRGAPEQLLIEKHLGGGEMQPARGRLHSHGRSWGGSNGAVRSSRTQRDSRGADARLWAGMSVASARLCSRAGPSHAPPDRLPASAQLSRPPASPRQAGSMPGRAGRGQQGGSSGRSSAGEPPRRGAAEAGAVRGGLNRPSSSRPSVLNLRYIYNHNPFRNLLPVPTFPHPLRLICETFARPLFPPPTYYSNKNCLRTFCPPADTGLPCVGQKLAESYLSLPWE